MRTAPQICESVILVSEDHSQHYYYCEGDSGEEILFAVGLGDIPGSVSPPNSLPQAHKP